MIRHINPCADCCDEVPPCCSSVTLPATATATLTINALAPLTISMIKTGPGYGTTSPYVLCDVGDGHTQIIVDVSILCFGDNWSLIFGYSVYTDNVLGNFTVWNYSYPAVTTPSGFSLSCAPFHMHFSGEHTTSVDGDGPTLACGGRTYPFDSTPGTINAVLDIVTP